MEVVKKAPALILVVIFVLIALAGSVSAVPPVQTTTTVSGGEGLIIEYIQDDNIEVDQPFEWHFHVYNESNGILLDNNTISCEGHMYDAKGMRVLTLFAQNLNPAEFYFNATAGNFSEVGLFSYQAHCNDSVKGGFVSGTILVTETGEASGEAEAIVYTGLLIIAIILACICIFITASINTKNEMDFGGLLKVNWNKYIKYFMFYLSYLMVWVVFFFAWQISHNFLLSAGFFVELLRLFYITLTILLVPLFIMTFLFALVKWLTDTKIHKLHERGLKPR